MPNEQAMYGALLNMKLFCSRYESCADCPLLQLDEYEDSKCIIQDYMPKNWVLEQINDIAREVTKEMKKT